MKKFIIGKILLFGVVAACIGFGIGLYAYFTPYTFVSLDVNPSVEYSVNRFNRVIAVGGVNDDGTKIIDAIKLGNLKNEDIETAVELTISQIIDSGYFDAEKGGIIITASSENMNIAEKQVQGLKGVAAKIFENNDSEVTIMAESVDSQRVLEAHKLGTTPGKLILVEQLAATVENSGDLDMSLWLKRSVRDIIAEISQNQDIKAQEIKNNADMNLKNISTDKTVLKVSDTKNENTYLVGDKTAADSEKLKLESNVSGANPNGQKKASEVQYSSSMTEITVASQMPASVGTQVISDTVGKTEPQAQAGQPDAQVPIVTPAPEVAPVPTVAPVPGVIPAQPVIIPIITKTEDDHEEDSEDKEDDEEPEDSEHEEEHQSRSVYQASFLQTQKNN